MVRKKVPLAALADHEVIPEMAYSTYYAMNIPTDVIEVGLLRAQQAPTDLSSGSRRGQHRALSDHGRHVRLRGP